MINSTFSKSQNNTCANKTQTKVSEKSIQFLLNYSKSLGSHQSNLLKQAVVYSLN